MKAILVVDLLGDYNLDELKAYVEVSFKDNNQILCGLFNKELKPMPKKIEVDVKKIEDIMHTEFQTIDVIRDKFIARIKLDTDKLIAIGYNGCIDEIQGGKKQ